MEMAWEEGQDLRSWAEALTLEGVAMAIDRQLEQFAGACHVMSLALVKSDLAPPVARVARGFCAGVRSQHSWVALGDPFDRDTIIVDPTLWTYREDVDGLWVGTIRDGLHKPHGYGSIYSYGRPCHAGGEVIDLDTAGLSDDAREFLEMLGPLDRTGWSHLLSHAPVGGWPAAEIVDRACDNPELRPIIPIDRIGMLTDRNPGGVYLDAPREQEPVL